MMTKTDANRLAIALIKTLEETDDPIPASVAGMAAEIAEYGTIAEADAVVRALVADGLFTLEHDLLGRGPRFAEMTAALVAFNAQQ
jgi:hypothetical protein